MVDADVLEAVADGLLLSLATLLAGVLPLVGDYRSSTPVIAPGCLVLLLLAVLDAGVVDVPLLDVPRLGPFPCPWSLLVSVAVLEPFVPVPVAVLPVALLAPVVLAPVALVHVAPPVDCVLFIVSLIALPGSCVVSVPFIVTLIALQVLGI